jgi:hypothetical protein
MTTLYLRAARSPQVLFFHAGFARRTSIVKEPKMTSAGARSDQKRRVVEQIHEDESLTADLVDEAAETLLDWSAAQAEAAFQEAEELSQAKLNACVARLRRLLKRVSRQAGRTPPHNQAQRVRSLLARMESSTESDSEG